MVCEHTSLAFGTIDYQLSIKVLSFNKQVSQEEKEGRKRRYLPALRFEIYYTQTSFVSTMLYLKLGLPTGPVSPG